MDLASNKDFLNSVLSQWITGEGRAMKMTNDLVRNSYQFAEMLQGDKVTLQGGKDVRFDALLDADDTSGFVDPYDVRQVRATQHSREGNLPWSFFEASTTWSDEEAGLNEGEFKIFDLIESRTEGDMTAAANKLETTFFDASGNFASLTGAHKKFPGLKYYVTRDGLAADGSASVAGISTSVSPNWKSRYAGPLGNNLNKDLSDDTSDTLTSANQLLRFIRKAWRNCMFRKPPNAKMAEDDSPMSKDRRSQKIYADEIGYDALEQLLSARNRADDMANRETDVGLPVWRGQEIDYVEDLGLGSGGIPSDITHGSITTGLFPNTGEVMMLKLRYFKPILHEKASPRRMPVTFLDLQQLWWQLWKWWLTVACISRKRQCCLWGFQPIRTG